MFAAFESNAKRLADRDPELLEAIAAADPSRLQRDPRGEGGGTVRVDGQLLASAYDPESEARAHAAPLIAAEPDLLVVLGPALGHVVEAFRAARNASVVVYEPSLAHWRAALESRELPWLSDPAISVAATPEQLSRQFRRAYTAGMRTEVWVHPVLQQRAPEPVAEALRSLANAKRNSDIVDRTRVRKSEDFAQRSVDNLAGVLASPDLGVLKDAFAGVPAVVVAAGPSLDLHLDTLREERERALVVAIGQSLPALRRAGIRPDLTHIIESQDVSHQLRDAGASADVDLVVIPSAHPALFETPVASRFVAVPDTNPVARWLAGQRGTVQSIPGASTVAQSAVHVAAALGANPILLIGQDLAFSGGRAYAEGSAYRMISVEKLDDGRFVYTGEEAKARLLNQRVPSDRSVTTPLVRVPGWDGNEVTTSPQYATFIDHYFDIAQAFEKRGIRLINCSEQGARIPGLEHRPFAETLSQLGGPRPEGGRIRAAFRAATPGAPDPLRKAERRARSGLRGFARALKRGHRALEGARRAGTDRARLEALRRLVAWEKQLLRRIERLPWLEMLGQPAVQRAAIAMHRSQERQPFAGALEDASSLLAASSEAEGRADALLDQLDQRLAELEAL